MIYAQDVHRAWVLIGVGTVFLTLSGLQIWTGKTVAKGGRIILRKKEPKSFWFNIFLTTTICLWCWLLGISRIAGAFR